MTESECLLQAGYIEWDNYVFAPLFANTVSGDGLGASPSEYLPILDKVVVFTRQTNTQDTHTHTCTKAKWIYESVCTERSVRLGCRCMRRQPYRYYRSHCYRVYKHTHSCTTTTRPPLTMCCRVFGQYLPRKGRIFYFVICYQIIRYLIGGYTGY